MGEAAQVCTDFQSCSGWAVDSEHGLCFFGTLYQPTQKLRLMIYDGLGLVLIHATC